MSGKMLMRRDGVRKCLSLQQNLRLLRTAVLVAKALKMPSCTEEDAILCQAYWIGMVAKVPATSVELGQPAWPEQPVWHHIADDAPTS